MIVIKSLSSIAGSVPRAPSGEPPVCRGETAASADVAPAPPPRRGPQHGPPRPAQPGCWWPPVSPGWSRQQQRPPRPDPPSPAGKRPADPPPEAAPKDPVHGPLGRRRRDKRRRTAVRRPLQRQGPRQRAREQRRAGERGQLRLPVSPRGQEVARVFPGPVPAGTRATRRRGGAGPAHPQGREHPPKEQARPAGVRGGEPEAPPRPPAVQRRGGGPGRSQ